MASILRLPDEPMRDECLRLMRAHVGALPTLRPESVKIALRRAYATTLDRTSIRAGLRDDEHEAIAEWEQRLLDPEWLAGPALAEPHGRQVKIRAGVWVYDGACDGVRLRISVEHGRVRHAWIEAPSLNGTADGIATALVGVTARLEDLTARLDEFGDDGCRVLDALAPGLVVA
jgi:hypothetical protein